MRYGPFTSVHGITEQGVLPTVEQWIDVYLKLAETDAGWTAGETARPMTYWTRQVLEAIPGEDATPAVIVVTRGSNDNIRRSGDGNYAVPLDVGLAAVTMGQDQVNAREIAGVYGAALAGIMIDNKLRQDERLGGRLKVLSWDTVSLDDLPSEEQRSRAVVRMNFTVLATNLMRATGGPADPGTTPDTGPWPVARTVDVLDTDGGVMAHREEG